MDTKEEIRLAWAARDYKYLAYNAFLLLWESFPLPTIAAFSAFVLKLWATWLILILLDATAFHGAGREALASFSIGGDQIVGVLGIGLFIGWLSGWCRHRPSGER